jgi:SAM-dependent methyltransferase
MNNRKFKKLHLGCGNHYIEGYVNCDISNDVGCDKIVDLEESLPFEDDSVDEIIINHTLEHVKNFNQLMEEFHRVCVDKAIIKIKVPYFSSLSAFQDPTHVRFFTHRTFDYYNPDFHYSYYSKARFKVVRKQINFTPSRKCVNSFVGFFVNKPLLTRIYERFFAFIIPMEELVFELENYKPNTQTPDNIEQ